MGAKTYAALSSVLIVNFPGSSTAVERAYITVPYAIVGISGQAQICAGTVGTGASIVVSVTDTAGGTMISGTFTSAGTAGQQVLTLAAGGTNALSSGGVLCVTKASCATAYGATVSIYVAKTAL